MHQEQRQRAEEEMQQMRQQETEERLRAEQRRAKLEEEMEMEEILGSKNLVNLGWVGWYFIIRYFFWLSTGDAHLSGSSGHIRAFFSFAPC